MRRNLLFFGLACALSSFFVVPDFVAEQKKYAKVKTAYAEKKELLAARLKEMNLNLDNIHILINVYKQEQEMEIFVKGKAEQKYRILATYSICQGSGVLGPKRRQGDLQVPEGFYHINKFNPASNYYLSLGVSYPNKADLKKTAARDPGGAIFIHGECVTIGCMPMTNDKIKEIYLYAVQARNNGQLKIPVYIFPFRFTDGNWSKFREQYKLDPGLVSFWENLKAGYDKFQKNLTEVNPSVDSKGNYVF